MNGGMCIEKLMNVEEKPKRYEWNQRIKEMIERRKRVWCYECIKEMNEKFVYIKKKKRQRLNNCE